MRPTDVLLLLGYSLIKACKLDYFFPLLGEMFSLPVHMLYRWASGMKTISCSFLRAFWEILFLFGSEISVHDYQPYLSDTRCFMLLFPHSYSMYFLQRDCVHGCDRKFSICWSCSHCLLVIALFHTVLGPVMMFGHGFWMAYGKSKT